MTSPLPFERIWNDETGRAARRMTESDLVAALRPVAEALDALGVRYFVGPENPRPRDGLTSDA